MHHGCCKCSADQFSTVYLLIYLSRIAANVAWVAKINKDKRNGKYDEWAGKGDDRDPNFKMVL